MLKQLLILTTCMLTTQSYSADHSQQKHREKDIEKLLSEYKVFMFFFNPDGYQYPKDLILNLPKNYERSLKSSPNIVNDCFPEDIFTPVNCLIKRTISDGEEHKEWSVFGYKSGNIALHTLTSSKGILLLEYDLPDVVTKVPVTALAFESCLCNLCNLCETQVKLVAGYKNGNVVLYKFPTSYIIMKISERPITCIAQGPMQNTWLFGTDREVIIAMKNKNGLFANVLNLLTTCPLFSISRIGLTSDGIFIKINDNSIHQIKPKCNNIRPSAMHIAPAIQSSSDFNNQDLL